MSKIIAVDFDGTLCEEKWPGIGKPRMHVIKEAIARQRAGDTIILWTCREGARLIEAIEWLAKQGLCCDYVNMNAPWLNEKYGNDSRKIGADEYWDDRSVRK